ncbi:MAG: hypothetical protein L0323_05235 [Planctomycetes bacterium]|nr:hypothetical protein [Planctomycetota bacterium]
MKALLLSLFAPLLACRQKSEHTWETVVDLFCDGATITAVAQVEHVKASRSPLEHGSGRHDEVTGWVGLVRWALPPTPPEGRLKPQGITLLGREHATARDARGASLPEVLARACSSPDTLLFEDGAHGRLSLRRASAPRSPAFAEFRIDPCMGPNCEVVPTRSGRHLLAKNRGKFSILAGPDLSAVREFGSGAGFSDFQGRFRRVEDHARILTDDLRYWIKVPFNAGEPQGFNHCKAVVYDIAEDATREVALSLGPGPTGIEDAESLEGNLQFLARHGETLHVVDPDSKVLASLPAARFGSASPGSLLFWDPARRRIAAWHEPDENVLSLGPIQVFVHDYGTGNASTYELDWADTVARLRAQG